MAQVSQLKRQAAANVAESTRLAEGNRLGRSEQDIHARVASLILPGILARTNRAFQPESVDGWEAGSNWVSYLGGNEPSITVLVGKVSRSS